MRPPTNHFPGRRLSRVAAGALAVLVFGLAGSLRAALPGEPAPLRLGFSSLVFSEVNESDARAAIKIWAQTMAADRGIPVDPAIKFFTDRVGLEDALRHRTIDGLTITAAEFWALRRVAPLGPLILGRTNGETTEEYLLLVHRDHPATRLADLRGQSVAVLQGSRASLAGVWLETLLLEEKLGPAPTFWKRTVPAGKLARVVLPVFFRQLDACVVTRAGFRTMSELNPEVGRQLRVLARSIRLVPDLFCFRGDLVSPYRDKLLATVELVVNTPAGRQLLTLFQASQPEVRPVSDLDTACALLDRHQALLLEAANASATNSGAPALPGDQPGSP